jgi:hypothetical protein
MCGCNLAAAAAQRLCSGCAAPLLLLLSCLCQRPDCCCRCQLLLLTATPHPQVCCWGLGQCCYLAQWQHCCQPLALLPLLLMTAGNQVRWVTSRMHSLLWGRVELAVVC